MKTKNILMVTGTVVIILLCVLGIWWNLSQRKKNIVMQSDDVNIESPDSVDASTEEVTEAPKKKVYLTFDDGPSIYTGQILDILAANDVKATFFVIGRDQEAYWEYYKRIVDEGHTLGMHSYAHNYKELYSSIDAFDEDFDKLSDLLYEVTGERSKIYRFPGGSSNTVSSLPMKQFIGDLNDKGITYFDWNAMNGDAVTETLSPKQLVNNIMDNVRKQDTSVVLMHDLQAKHETVESLQMLIDTLKEEGYDIEPIDENTPLVQHVPYTEGESTKQSDAQNE